MREAQELTLNTFSDLQGKLTALFNQEFSNLSMKYSKQYVWAKETMDRKINNVRLAHESQLFTYRMQLEEHNRMEQDTIRRQYEQSIKEMEDTIGENLRKTKEELEKVTKERSALANVHHEMVQRQKELETAIEKMANERDKALKEATKIAEQSVKTVSQYDDLGTKYIYLIIIIIIDINQYYLNYKYHKHKLQNCRRNLKHQRKRIKN